MFSSILNLNKVQDATELISAYDNNLRVTFWNPACERRLGIAAKDAVGKDLFELFPYSRDDQRTKFLTIAMMVNQTFFFPNMIYLYTQPYTYYTQYIYPIKENGKITGVINMVRDHEMEESFTVNDFSHLFHEDYVAADRIFAS